MSPILWGIIGFCVLFLLIFLNMPIGFSMALVGLVGICILRGIEAGFSAAGIIPFRLGSYYIMSVVPLFIFMGYLASQTGLSSSLFAVINKWIGQWRGGLAMATIGACTVFAAICGCAVATATTMAAVALPEMRKHKYSDELSLGCLAAGGNLGFIIPPSIGFMIYGILTETSIGTLFIAGILPGLLLAALFIATIYVTLKINPKLAARAPASSWGERFRSLPRVSGSMILILLVLGGIYGGIFTPTEAGAVGVFGVIILGLAGRQLAWHGFGFATRDTAKMTGMVFILIIGAMIFSRFMTVTEIPLKLAGFVAGLNLPPVAILGSVLLAYIILGCIMDIMAIIVLVAPILHPLLVGLGFDPIWLGVVTIITVLMGHISPPVGIVVYALGGMVRDVPLFVIFRGALPYLGAMFVCLIILVAFPQISLFLPNLMIPG